MREWASILIQVKFVGGNIIILRHQVPYFVQISRPILVYNLFLVVAHFFLNLVLFVNYPTNIFHFKEYLHVLHI